jgi:undecaprenyl pyrophosphate synthase
MNNENKLNSILAAGLEQAAGDESKNETPTVNSLFADESQMPAYNSANQLNKTARLTQIASDLASKVFMVATGDIVNYEAAILASKKSHDAMDDLIVDCVDLGAVDIDFLKTESKEDLEKMIRSQQSKRSRSKSKVMTKENYQTMMTGAIAELLLRLAANMPKSAGGGMVMGDIGFSADDLEALSEFPDDLKKAIRNVQSKKSIMRAKQGFDEQSDRWQQLLVNETQLKEIRDRVNGLVNEQAVEALEVKKAAEEMLEDVDPASMSQEDAVNLLAKMKEMLASK